MKHPEIRTYIYISKIYISFFALQCMKLGQSHTAGVA